MVLGKQAAHTACSAGPSFADMLASSCAATLPSCDLPAHAHKKQQRISGLGEWMMAQGEALACGLMHAGQQMLW